MGNFSIVQAESASQWALDPPLHKIFTHQNLPMGQKSNKRCLFLEYHSDAKISPRTKIWMEERDFITVGHNLS